MWRLRIVWSIRSQAIGRGARWEVRMRIMSGGRPCQNLLVSTLKGVNWSVKTQRVKVALLLSMTLITFNSTTFNSVVKVLKYPTIVHSVDYLVVWTNGFAMKWCSLVECLGGVCCTLFDPKWATDQTFLVAAGPDLIVNWTVLSKRSGIVTPGTWNVQNVADRNVS